MADVSDVENALCALIESVVYPNGVTSDSVTATVVKIYRGWPSNRTLNTDLGSGSDTVTVFSCDHSTKNTSRYGRTWQPLAVVAPTITAMVDGSTVTLSGTCMAGQTVGLIVDGVAYARQVLAMDTLETVASALALEIPNATAQGDLIQTATLQVTARIVGSGTSIMETRRQEQGVMIAVWSATPAARDVLCSAIDQRLSDTDWFPLADGSSARLRYRETFETDVSENANLYRRNLNYTVEYPTTVTMSSSQMAFGIGRLEVSGATVGFSCLEPSARLIIPPLGAIRFDAWYDPANAIDRQCAAALSPAAYNFRLPPNAVLDNGIASWPLATQSTMDAEIAAALQAGLSFWAFDSYQPDDSLSLALQLYLSSASRGRLRFCMVGQTSNWGAGGEDQPPLLRDIQMMTQPDYMTVLGGRPLYFAIDSGPAQLAGLPAGGVAEAVLTIRRQVQLAGGKNPYIVWLSGASIIDYSNVEAAQEAGADAAGAYAVPRLNGSEQPYSALTSAATDDWAARSRTGFPMVPTAMSGWDQRPLIESPQSFYPISDSLTPGNFYATATSAALASHVGDLVQYIVAHPESCPAQVGLIYAWNELAEGGWLMPTYTAQGSDATRCAAIGNALSLAVSQSTKPDIILIN